MVFAVPDHDTAATGPGSPELTRANRLLACYQQALGHDLPNKLAAAQGLAFSLCEELAGSIPDESHALLARLAGLTRTIHAHTTALADLGRTCRLREADSAVELEDALTTALAEARSRHGGREVVFNRHDPLPTVEAPPGWVQRVLVELLSFAFGRADPGQCVRLGLGWEAGSLRMHVGGVCLSEQQIRQALGPKGLPAEANLPSLGLFLAGLLADAWGGRLSLTAPGPGGCLFTLEFRQGGLVPPA
jgi:K+-sensing histidine kinase KdpD